MHVATWNVNSLRVRLPQLLDWLRKAEPDVLCVQETKCTDDLFPSAALVDAGYPHLAFCGQKTYNGVAIISRRPLTDVVAGFTVGEPDPQCRLIRATVGGVRFIDCYVPNGQAVGSEKFAYKLQWLSRLRRELDATCDPGTPVVVLGDMNVALTDRDVWDPFEAEGEVLYHPLEREHVRKVLEWGLTDAYRTLMPEGRDYSWWDYRMGAFQRNHGFRIDHVFVSRPLVDRCREVRIWRETRKLDKPSDHAPVSVVLAD